MIQLIRSLAAPLLSLVLLIMASGLFNTFVSVRLEMEGYGPEAIGLVSSALYIGILCGSLRVDRLIGRIGHVYSLMLFAVSLSLLSLAQGVWINPWYWGVLRFCGGVSTAGVFIVIESWLLIQSTPKTRGAILSIYLGVFYGALTLGQFLINLSDPKGSVPFYITAILCLLATCPLLLRKTQEPKIDQAVRLGLTQLFRLSPLGFIGGIISGMVLAAVYGLVPVYAKEIGLSIPEIANLMAMIIFGGLSLQWPLGRWADRGGNRRQILYLASFLSAIFAFSIALVSHSLLLFLLAWAFGGFAFTLYPLSMAYTCEKVQDGEIVAATGGFVLSYGIGAIAGPILAPIAMDFFGSSGLFYFLSAISLLLGLIGLATENKETVS